MCLCAWCDTIQSGERPPRQHVAEHGQTVQGNPGLVTGSGQGCEAGCLCEANIILLGVLGVRHILLHSPPPPLLVLQTDNSLPFPFTYPFFSYLQAIAPQVTLSIPYRILFLFLLMGITSSIIPLQNAVCSYDTQTSGFKQQLSQWQVLLLCQELFARERPYCQQVLAKLLA